MLDGIPGRDFTWLGNSLNDRRGTCNDASNVVAPEDDIVANLKAVAKDRFGVGRRVWRGGLYVSDCFAGRAILAEREQKTSLLAASYGKHVREANDVLGIGIQAARCHHEKRCAFTIRLGD